MVLLVHRTKGPFKPNRPNKFLFSRLCVQLEVKVLGLFKIRVVFLRATYMYIGLM